MISLTELNFLALGDKTWYLNVRHFRRFLWPQMGGGGGGAGKRGREEDGDEGGDEARA